MGKLNAAMIRKLKPTDKKSAPLGWRRLGHCGAPERFQGLAGAAAWREW